MKAGKKETVNIAQLFVRRPYMDHRCEHCNLLLLRRWGSLTIKTKTKDPAYNKGLKHTISMTCPKCRYVTIIT